MKDVYTGFSTKALFIFSSTQTGQHKNKKGFQDLWKSGSLRKKTVIHFQLKLSKGKTSCAFSQMIFEKLGNGLSPNKRKPSEIRGVIGVFGSFCLTLKYLNMKFFYSAICLILFAFTANHTFAQDTDVLQESMVSRFKQRWSKIPKDSMQASSLAIRGAVDAYFL